MGFVRVVVSGAVCVYLCRRVVVLPPLCACRTERLFWKHAHPFVNDTALYRLRALVIKVRS